jgi:integrase
VRQFSTAHGVVLPLPPAYAANLAALSRKKGRRSRSRRLLNAVFAVHRTERDYGRCRTFIGSRGLRTVGLDDLSDFAATLTGSAATRRRTLSAIKALLTTGFKKGALRFNVGAALRLPKVVSRRAERRLEEIELFRLLTAVEKQPRDRAIIEALYGTGARVDELVQLRRRQLVPDLEGSGGYATLYGKQRRTDHPRRTAHVGSPAVPRRGQRPRRSGSSRSPMSASARYSPRRPRPRGCRRRSRPTGCATRMARTPINAVRRRPPSATPSATPHLSTTDVYLSSAPTDGVRGSV